MSDMTKAQKVEADKKTFRKTCDCIKSKDNIVSTDDCTKDQLNATFFSVTLGKEVSCKNALVLGPILDRR